MHEGYLVVETTDLVVALPFRLVDIAQSQRCSFSLTMFLRTFSDVLAAIVVRTSLLFDFLLQGSTLISRQLYD
jgi:hypothetical protein